MFILNYNLEPRNKVKSQSQQSMQVNIQLWFALSGVLVLVNSIIHISELFRKWKSMRAAGKCAIACALTRRRVGANQPIPAAIWVSFTWHSTLADSTLVNMLACSPVSTATPSLPFSTCSQWLRKHLLPLTAGTLAGRFASQIRDITSVRFYLPPCW